MSTQKKVVVVTGASQGIGAGVVEGFRKRGFAVVATSRSITPSNDPDVVTIAGDISDPETARRVVAAAVENFGRIDTLVNNAGVFASKPFTEWTQEDFESTQAVNVGGVFHVTQAVVARLLEQGEGGHVVSITTALVDQPDARVPAALASITKGGLNALTKGLAIEYASRGIRVNAVAPGLIKTPMNPEAYHETLAGMHPLNRMGEIDDIVDAILFLDSATFVTGEILHVDGGQNAGH
ncbi:SDR family oxidoreductase [Herbiconiux sp. CPCC 205763]|uniref:SDR family oxidoreductase n=1 Tax=Herbiconiux aconitum TaxID=2970913 RepID=A0ABT2GTX6_9MICO|nr:SDR family oxidoreductase [Herbiconiux aconitum]MCS5719667.1 SDR family oxidoreductase [Herbiconiux aconitum]